MVQILFAVCGKNTQILTVNINHRIFLIELYSCISLLPNNKRHIKLNYLFWAATTFRGKLSRPICNYFLELSNTRGKETLVGCEKK
jgi:hypothetical protein